MTEKEKARPSETLATHFAHKGEDAVAELQATVERAREMLASGEVQPYGEGENAFEVPLYDWEVSEPKSDAPRRIYLGSVSDLATGQGHSVHFAAGLARDGDEFRRQLAAHIGHVLSNGAKVNRGLDDVSFSKTFISPSLRQSLEKFDQGSDAPAGFFYLSRWHENRS
jgi:DNA-binding GntR family transcriptional regulator